MILYHSNEGNHMLSTEEIAAYLQSGKQTVAPARVAARADQLVRPGQAPGSGNPASESAAPHVTPTARVSGKAPAGPRVGLWIDHRRAEIVRLGESGADLLEIPSGVEKLLHPSGGPREAFAEDQRDRRYNGHLQKYFDAVVARIRDAAAILILGPGEAKIELKARLENEALGSRIAGVEAADKMSSAQLTGRVLEYFREGGR